MVSEAIHPHYGDIFHTKMQLHTIGTKSRRDCYIILSRRCPDILAQYWKQVMRRAVSDAELPVKESTAHESPIWINIFRYTIDIRYTVLYDISIGGTVHEY